MRLWSVKMVKPAISQNGRVSINPTYVKGKKNLSATALASPTTKGTTICPLGLDNIKIFISQNTSWSEHRQNQHNNSNNL